MYVIGPMIRKWVKAVCNQVNDMQDGQRSCVISLMKCMWVKG